jgi:hypothetical protein
MTSRKPHRLPAIISLVGGASCAAVLVLPTSPADAVATWSKVQTPNRGTVASALLDVAVVPGTSTAWAVGYSYDNNVAAYRTMTQRFNGTSWTTVASPNGSATGYNQLTKVDATSASNIWAIGYDSASGGLVLRYNGSSWTRLPAPATVALRGIDVVSPTEAWVAGYSGSQATVTHWKNGRWTTRFTLPAVGRHLSVFEGISVDAAGHVTAVGWDRDYNASGRPVSSLVVHFNGTSWTREATPNPGDRNTLTDVTTLAGGDIFAVGVSQRVSGGGITPTPLMLRKTGTTWSSLTVPAGDESDGQFQSVTAVSPNSVWAVGYYYAASEGLHQPLLANWTPNAGNGSLTTYDVTPPLGVAATAWGASATSGGTVWAVGYQSTASGDRTLALRGTGG